jgi:hypothetical protein
VVIAHPSRCSRAATGRISGRPLRLCRQARASRPRAYAEVFAAVGIPIGSIGPTRARLLERLRRDPHILAAAPE